MQNPNHISTESPEQDMRANPAVEQIVHLAVAKSVEAVPKEPYKVFINPYERMDYVHLTDDLIVTLDGSAEGSEGSYDAVIYLDSSARPVSWLVRGLWDFAARKDERGNPAPQPLTLFSNIDGRRSPNNTDEDDVRLMRETYTELTDWPRHNGDASPRVLIVDEIAVSGVTLEKAEAKFRTAFPGIDFKGYAWKDERGVSDKKRDNVRWYERDYDRYRAVLDPTELKDKQRQQLRERGIRDHGRTLSVINPDQRGTNLLRGEIARIIDEVTKGEMPYWPSSKRPFEEFDELVSAHNNGMNARQFRDFREWFKRYYAPSSRANLVTSDNNGPLTEREVRGHLDDQQLKKGTPKFDPVALKYAHSLGYKK